MRAGGSRLQKAGKEKRNSDRKPSERKTIEMPSHGAERGGKKLPSDIGSRLRHLTHDLSNSLETINQACYLLAKTRLDTNGKKWHSMIDAAALAAVRINRSIREILRSESAKPTSRRRAS